MLVDIPKDIVDPTNPRCAMEWYWPTDEEVASSLPGYKPTTKGHPKKIKEAAAMILGGARSRSSTPVAASSRPAPPRRCTSWPS